MTGRSMTNLELQQFLMDFPDDREIHIYSARHFDQIKLTGCDYQAEDDNVLLLIIHTEDL